MDTPCPQCRGPLRTVDPRRLDCPRCGAVVWLDGSAAGRSRGVGWLAAVVLGAALLSGGVGIGWTIGQAGSVAPSPVSPPEPVLDDVAPEPGAPVPAPFVMSPEPQFLEDPEAMAALPGRIAAVTDGFTGRFRYLALDRTPVAVALVEVGPDAVDSVVFSWGAQVLDTLPLDAEERARLPNELFDLRPDQLAAIPALVDRVMAQSPPDSSIDRVTVLGIGGPPRIEVGRSHPREVLPTLTFDLDGAPR